MKKWVSANRKPFMNRLASPLRCDWVAEWLKWIDFRLPAHRIDPPCKEGCVESVGMG